MPGPRAPRQRRDDGSAGHRIGELSEAMAPSGSPTTVGSGGEGRYRDSGMMGTPQNDHPQAFWQADLEEAADHLVAILRDVRPDVLVTYDPHGGYGHPDHIQTHRVATYAVALAAAASHRADLGPAHDVAKVYWNAFPQWQVEEQMRRLEAAKADGLNYGLPDVASYLEHRTCPDEAIAAQLDGSPSWKRRRPRWRRTRRQLEVDGDIYALTNRLAALVLPDECYRLAKGRSGDPTGSRTTCSPASTMTCDDRDPDRSRSVRGTPDRHRRDGRGPARGLRGRCRLAVGPGGDARAVPLVLTGVGRAGTQVAAWSAAAGWFLPVAVLLLVHPGGDQIPGRTPPGWPI